jgi:hypothetical protein
MWSSSLGTLKYLDLIESRVKASGPRALWGSRLNIAFFISLAVG